MKYVETSTSRVSRRACQCEWPFPVFECRLTGPGVMPQSMVLRLWCPSCGVELAVDFEQEGAPIGPAGPPLASHR